MQLLLLEQFDAPIDYFPNFLVQPEADWLLAQSQTLTWQQNQITMLGKVLPVPRLETSYGDSGCDYLYSGSVLLQPHPWTEWLLWLKDKIETTTQYQYHLAIGNRYRTGQDSISWHADDEKSMGQNPAIASISLGATRRFSLRPKQGGTAQHFDLEHGSLLFMKPGCQSTHQHQVAKTSKFVEERINWTFRPHIQGDR